MKALGDLFASLFGTSKDTSERAAIRREWDRQRAEALTPSHRAEIDAIFSRHL